MTERRPFPKWLRVAGWIIFPGATALVIRLLYETEQGYLVGYGLVHDGFLLFFLFFLGALCWYLLWPWVIIAIVIIVRRRLRLEALDWLQFALLTLDLLAFLLAPFFEPRT